MRKNGYGKIIHCSSVLGFISLPFRGAYNISKWALEGYTDTLRLELNGSGINVISIRPGPINTKIKKKAKEMLIVAFIAEAWRTGSHRRRKRRWAEPYP